MARNTAHKHGDPDGEQAPKLRSKPVIFVSAGVVEPLKELDEELTAHIDRGHASQEATETIGIDGIAVSPASEDPKLFFIDTTGNQSQSLREHQPCLIPSFRQRTPSSSSSSDDVVVFKGRNSVRPSLEYKSGPQSATRPVPVDLMTVQVQKAQPTMQHVPIESTGQLNNPRQHASCSPPAWQLRGHDDQADVIADYMANMAREDEEDDGESQMAMGRLMPSFGARDLGGSDCDIVLADGSQGETSEVDQTQDRKRSAACDDDDDDGGEGDAETLDDEALARLLAKQVELGLDDDDIALYSTEVTHEVKQSSGKQAVRHVKTFTDRGKKRGQIPSASAIADAFDELDLMDWDRHNPPRKPKSKRGQPDFNISDSELETALQSAWSKDRLRKKERKMEREELRAQGLLGKKADPNDMRVKYPVAMTMDQIKEEMRDFLIGTNETFVISTGNRLFSLTIAYSVLRFLGAPNTHFANAANLALVPHSRSFPPMDSDARKKIHELSLKFNIKSKSTGKGDTRRPVLHRTKHTVQYHEDYFESVFNRPGRKYFHRMDKNRPRNKGAGAGGGGGGASGRSNNGRGGIDYTAFSYKDGEVVGGSAPELGQNNKGRALLEKMGWSTGMALGATDNKGILQPVAHVVKRTKAGLG